MLTMRAILVAAGLLLAGPAWGQDASVGWNGNRLHDICNSSAGPSACLGYVAGAFEASVSVGRYKYCFGSGATYMQMVDVVRKFLVENPQHRNMPGPDIVILSLMTHFPCPSVAPSQR